MGGCGLPNNFGLSLTPPLFASNIQPGLFCFKREPKDPIARTAAVPYCSGGEADNPGKDYCTMRGVGADLLWLHKVADNQERDDGEPIEGSLTECQGDCDDDSDCAVRKIVGDVASIVR